MATLTRKIDHYNRNGVFTHTAIATETGTRTEMELLASRLEWLNENRVPKGKYYAIEIDGVPFKTTADAFRATL